MTQTELNRAVSDATGETVDTIANRGFSPLFDLERDEEPQSVDWDRLDEQTTQLFPRRRRSPTTI